jgi:hypothetical protein
VAAVKDGHGSGMGWVARECGGCGSGEGWVRPRYGMGVVQVWGGCSQGMVYIRWIWLRYVVAVAQACGGCGPGMG